MGLLGAVAVDVFIDGLLLGIGFAVGVKEGVLLAFALATEFLSLGLATSATLGQNAGAVRWQSIATTSGMALPFAGVLSFACAALLYLVTEELLVEAHEVKETIVATSMFFAGFLLFLILGMLE